MAALHDEWREEVRRDIETMKADMSANTALTVSTNTKLDAVDRKLESHIEKTTGVIDAWDRLQAGMRVMDAIGRGGSWLARKWLWMVAIFIGVKILLSGGSWAEAGSAISKLMKQ